VGRPRTSATRLTGSRLALVVVLLSGCPRPELRFGPSGEVSDPQVLLKALNARGSVLYSLVGGGNLSVKSPRGGGSAGLNIAAERPAKLRVEVLGFFGSPVVVLATDGERMEISQTDKGAFSEGPATAHSLARVVPVALAPQDLVSLLFGDPPLLPGGSVKGLRVDADRRAYALSLVSGERTEVVYQDLETLLPVGAEVDGPDGWRAEFTDYQTHGDFKVPGRIQLVSSDGQTELHLTYRKVRVNIVIEGDLFQLIAPKGGAQVTPID
jgi:outer membrane biogenesis lipoprotein LolB